MPEYECDVTVTKTFEKVKVTADNEDQVEELAGSMSEADLLLLDPSPLEDSTVDNIECIDGCDEEEEEAG